MQRFNAEQKRNLLELYSEEICSRIAQNIPPARELPSLSPLKSFGHLLHPEEFEEVLSNSADGDDTDRMDDSIIDEENGNEEEENEDIGDVKKLETAHALWRKFDESALSDQLYPAVMEFIKNVDDELHKSICVERYVTEFVSGFRKMLTHMPRIISAIMGEEDEEHLSRKRWTQFAAKLNTTINGANQMVDPLNRRIQAGEIEIRRAMKILLRTIPTSNINGYEHILYAIANCGDKLAESIVDEIYPDFYRQYDYLKSSALNPNNCFYIIGPEDDMASIIEMAMKNGHGQPPSEANVFYPRLGKIPPIQLRACNIDIMKEKPLNLRPYQKELATEACDGCNVIICAPTGSGKTIVGAYIIREHLTNAFRRGQKAKACFIVPTNALVDQQKRLFQKHIGHFSTVRGLSGQSEGASITNPIRLTIGQADVVVITPQLLINLLNESPSELTENAFQPFTLDTFTLIIFDESHHSKDDHPYNQIMTNYHEIKLLGAHKGRLPQIIGMTASLGIGGSDSKNLEKAIQYILEICANMDSKWISCVRKNKDNLSEYMPSVAEKIIPISGETESQVRFFDKLMKYLDQIWQSILEIPECKSVQEFARIMESTNAKDPKKQNFENWLCGELCNLVRTSTIISNTSRVFLNFCREQMLLLYNSIRYLNLFGPKTTLRFIDKEEAELTRTGTLESTDRIRRWMLELREIMEGENGQTSPLLDKLIRFFFCWDCRFLSFSILNEQFANSNSIGRVLIFLQQRQQCQLLSELLNEKTEHRTDFFTGKASREESGQNSKVQKAKLEDFSQGKIKVLCSTTVAEEGIDISKCNLIIHYNYVTNEIARVQRRGRGRAYDAKSILLTCEQWIEEKENQNMLREQLMNQALDELARWSRTKFRQKVDALVDELNRKRKEKDALAKSIADERRCTDSVFHILCSNCCRFLGLSTAMAQVHSAYVIADREFWSRTGGDAGNLPPEKADSRECKGSTPHVGEHRCSCNLKLGRVIQHRGGILLPNLKLERIVFLSCNRDGTELVGGGKRFTETKWSKVTKNLFLIGKITPLQLAEMKIAPNRPTKLAIDESKSPE